MHLSRCLIKLDHYKMASVNKAILVGNLGRDPEMRMTQAGEAIANLSLATTDTWVDKQTGQKQESTEWHRVTFFGKTAEIAGQYLKKGSDRKSVV